MRGVAGILALIFATSVVAQSSYNLRDVVINEIAWMGTEASANDEWIELYNNTDSDIDLADWTLVAEDGTPDISLSGTIPAHSYFLLERSDDNTISDIAADLIYTGSLENTGENLMLKDPAGNVVDQVNCNAGWFAGDNGNKSSMERKHPNIDGNDQNSWGTNDGQTRNGSDAAGNPVNGTPKAENSVYDSSLPVTLVFFRASRVSDGFVQLEWRTASESEILGFRIARQLSAGSGWETRSPLIAARGNGSRGASYEWQDEGLPQGTSQIRYALTVRNLDGTIETLAMVNVSLRDGSDDTKQPSGFSLSPAYPNPFGAALGSAVTRVAWQGGRCDRACVLNALGQVVAELPLRRDGSVEWDGRDFSGAAVPTGMYFIRVDRGRESLIRPITFVR